MIWNPGQLPTAWTLEHLLGKHSSEPFNPNIANAFFRAGMIESWGRGIERIVDACRAAGMPEPELRNEHTGLWVEFPFPEKRVRRTTQETTQKTTQKTTPITTPISTQRQLTSLILARPDISQQELAVALGLTRDGVKYHINKMKHDGVIRHMGPTRGDRWKVLK